MHFNSLLKRSKINHKTLQYLIFDVYKTIQFKHYLNFLHFLKVLKYNSCIC
jgi:hypothetical protein